MASTPELDSTMAAAPATAPMGSARRRPRRKPVPFDFGQVAKEAMQYTSAPGDYRSWSSRRACNS
ncbi:MAG: hypothetical protein M3083_05245 [Actinomycetota bacterium]|nr:hypothetical protein [Actinomycetota bacterium]